MSFSPDDIGSLESRLKEIDSSEREDTHQSIRMEVWQERACRMISHKISTNKTLTEGVAIEYGLEQVRGEELSEVMEISELRVKFDMFVAGDSYGHSYMDEMYSDLRSLNISAEKVGDERMPKQEPKILDSVYAEISENYVEESLLDASFFRYLLCVGLIHSNIIGDIGNVRQNCDTAVENFHESKEMARERLERKVLDYISRVRHEWREDGVLDEKVDEVAPLVELMDTKKKDMLEHDLGL